MTREEAGRKVGLSNKEKAPWNKGISTKKIGKSRQVTTKINNTCWDCENDFVAWRIHGRKFCSRSCAARFQLKQGHLRESNIGLKISKAKKGIPNYKMRGAGHPNWLGGITPILRRIRRSIEMHLWRKAVFERDNFTCQKYGTLGGELHPHHINNFADYPELRFSIDNGVTLSKKAHNEFHHKYGRKNNTIEQLVEFLMEA